MEKVPLQHKLDQEAARDPHEQERRRRLGEERRRIEIEESVEAFLQDREKEGTQAIEEIMNNSTVMVDSQQLQLHQLQQLKELQSTAINAQGIDFDDLQQFTTNLQFTNIFSL